MTITDLEKKLSMPPFHVFGIMTHEIQRTRNQSAKIIFTDVDNGVIVDEQGKPTEVNYHDESICCAITLDNNNEIVFIEHGYRYFTKSNKEEVIAMAQLIGEKITDVELANN